MGNNILVYVGIGLGVILLVILVLFAIGKGNAVKAFFDFIISRFKIFLSLFGLVKLKDILKDDGGKALQEIKTENDRIKAELEALKKRLAETDAKLAEERDRHGKEIIRLQELIRVNDQKVKDTEAMIKDLRSKSPMQWFQSLPKDVQDKLLADIDKGIKWE